MLRVKTHTLLIAVKSVKSVKKHGPFYGSIYWNGVQFLGCFLTLFGGKKCHFLTRLTPRVFGDF